MGFHATTTASRAERQSPGMMPNAMLSGPMDAPCANSRKGTAAFVTQLRSTSATAETSSPGQGEAALAKDAIESTVPLDAQTLINMCRSGPALNPSEATVPRGSVAAGQSNPGRRGRIPGA